MSDVVDHERLYNDALSALDPALAERVKEDHVVGHEYFDEEDPKHVALKKAVEARQVLLTFKLAAKIRQVA